MVMSMLVIATHTHTHMDRQIGLTSGGVVLGPIDDIQNTSISTMTVMRVFILSALQAIGRPANFI